ncbi:ABC transporter permease [Paenibacillus sp. GSMTC-2017]|uniref:ABC transporter permease n=1 Tax=Paenibacillus sp. GSMTC-2017 TaxID=2794350 RepID=UPI0018D7796A|nr:ABC transporter permease [Paenibacillus sp. GSMTC-2017]MBH5319219.1 ABC transporter permease [Paenibacillus sp. GSMTC-2017]
MTFRSLALSNIRGNWRSYSAFFLSSVFSVLIFYVYAAFISHPDVLSGVIIGADKVRQGMQFCLYLIIIFSFMFILYSNSAFLKTRKQEFGLFSLFGMTKSQLRKLVIYENIVISILAISVGIGLGILFSKLFFMALTALLGLNKTIAFVVPMKAVWMTAGGFFALFMIISILTVLKMRRVEIIELLRASKQPKGELKYSPWLVAIGAICLIAGYGMAVIMTSYTFIVFSLPILITVVAGTYFLFTQLSIVVLRWVQNRHSIYYKRTNMLIFAQLGYKIRDNARILFVVSIMSAVIMTAMGTVYIMHIWTKQGIVETSPYTIGYVEEGLHTHQVMNPDEMRTILKKDNVAVKHEAKVIGIGLKHYSVNFDDGTTLGSPEDAKYKLNAMIISATDYNKLAALQGKQTLTVESGKLIALYPNFDKLAHGSGEAIGKINDKRVQLPVERSINDRVISNWIDSNGTTFVMDDLTYLNLLSNISEDKQLVFYGYELSNWENAAPTVEKIAKLIPDEMKFESDLNRSIQYKDTKEMVSLTLFIGMFISLLFFIAAGSMIYFKLFTEIQEDQAQFKGLFRIGMTRKEVRRIVVSQIAIIFYLPCIVGISHALFAMVSLDNMMMASNWSYSFVVIGIYIAMQTIYFLLASNSYMKSMLRGTNA